MRKIRSIAVSVATALLMTFMVSLFVPGFAFKVNAADGVISVTNEAELKSALESSASKGKTVQVSKTINLEKSISINTSLTLDLNDNKLIFSEGYFLTIDTKDKSDIVTIYGGSNVEGCIIGQLDGYLISLMNGKLIFDGVNCLNNGAKGYIVTSSKNVMIISGLYQSKGKMGDDIVIPFSEVDKDSYGSFERTRIRYSALSIYGKAVTPNNCEDILGNGIFSYDPWIKTLYIKGDYDSDSNSQLKSLVEDLTINISQKSTLKGGFDLYYSTTITGNNKLILLSDQPCIVADNLTIKDVSIELNGKIGIVCCADHLLIDNSEIIANTSEAAISDDSVNVNTIELKNCELTEPEGCKIVKGEILTSDGKEQAKGVKIQPLDYYFPAEYTWSDDYSKCTAKRVYKYDSSVIETETVTTTSTIKTPATSSTKGTTTYTATFLNKGFVTQTKDVQNIPVSAGGGFEDFVERLYTVALNRASEPEGKAFWCEHVGNGDLNGAQCANEFLLSKEFNDRKLSDEDFLKVLYKTFFDRDAADDPDCFNFWMNSLKTEGRDKVVDGFINSTEWCNICASYGVKSGATRAKATIASKNATEFATRLYTECLGRDPEEGGLKFWSLGLTNLELTGKQAAHEFFFSKEFNDFNLDNEGLLTRMYKTFMGREPDDDGMNYWLKEMENGMTKEQVFNEFVKSKEFTEICQKYAIDRG